MRNVIVCPLVFADLWICGVSDPAHLNGLAPICDRLGSQFLTSLYPSKTQANGNKPFSFFSGSLRTLPRKGLANPNPKFHTNTMILTVPTTSYYQFMRYRGFSLGRRR